MKTQKKGQEPQSTKATHNVLGLKLVFHALEAPQLSTQLEGSANRVLGGEGDERGRSEGLVSVDTGERVAQRIVLRRNQALVTPTPDDYEGGCGGS